MWFAAIFAFFAGFHSTPAHAQACQDLTEVPEGVQVAWISPIGKRVSGGKTIEVVRVADLRRWVRDNGADPGRVAQGLGIAPRRGGRRTEVDYKIVIFDVKAEWICRPVLDVAPGTDLLGVAACDDAEGGPLSGRRHGWTGCGYTLDTGASTRGLDVFRVQWRDAATWGFCTMPLDRFISGA
jgi:hypothetical protein